MLIRGLIEKNSLSTKERRSAILFLQFLRIQDAAMSEGLPGCSKGQDSILVGFCSNSNAM